MFFYLFFSLLVQGIATPSATPGGRAEALMWYYNNFIYLYGGKGPNGGNDNQPLINI